MLTIFSTPKPFKDEHINIIQRNAIKSWTLLEPRPDIILLGDDEGTAEICMEFGLRHIPKIERNEFGTPLVNSIFSEAEKAAKYQFMCYLNADIILLSNFFNAIKKVNYPLFLLIGRRWDLDVKKQIAFDKDWERSLCEDIKARGTLHGFSGIDYFVYPRKLSPELPAFAIGRAGWDNWFIFHIRSSQIPVIDATEVISVVHQNHDYSHCLNGQRDMGPETPINFKLAGGSTCFCTLNDSDFLLTAKGIKKPEFPRRFFAWMSLYYPWRFLLSIKRTIGKEIFQFLSR